MITTSEERPSDAVVPYPVLSFLWLEITGRCNLACEHCYAESSPRGTHGNMQPRDWERVIVDAADLGCSNLQFIGGEPTTHPFLNRLICLATERGMMVEVYTNLLAIKPAHWETFQSCQVRIATSFYSLHPSIHEQITNGGKHSFHKTVSNIRHVIQLGLPLRVGLIETRLGQDIEATKQFLQNLGVEHIGRDRVRSVGRGTHLTKVARPEDALCGACAQGKAAVVSNGNVYPCVFSRHLRLGNTIEQPFAEVMQSRTTAATREKLQTFFVKKYPNRFVRHGETNPCQPHKSVRASDKSVLSDTVPLRAPLTTAHRQPFASRDCNPNVCTPDDCEPFCEPYYCAPDLPPCKPTTLCLPDFVPPYPPCSPDICNPDACNPNKLPE